MARFEFYIRPSETEVNVFSLGDLTIVGTEGKVTTKDNPRYSMMVFLSIAFFLDALQSFFLTESLRSSRQCNFDGIDGSFEAHILRENKREYKHMIAIKVFGEIISREPKDQFIRELWQSVEPFVSHHRANFDDTDNPDVISDLDASMREFAEAFADILNDN
jgi:hypothetical protein